MASADRNSPDRTNAELDSLIEAARFDEQSTLAASGIDPTLAETIRRLRSLDRAHELDRTIVARIWDELMVQSVQAENVEKQGSLKTPSLNGQHQPISRLAPQPLPVTRDMHRIWAGIQIAAALLIIALAIGYFGFRSGIGRNDHRKTIPAVVGQPTPSPNGVSEELLMKYTIPAEEIPRSSIGMGITRNTIAPGNRSTWEAYCCPGPMLEYILAGSYTIRAEKQIAVWRADGSSALIPAAQEVTLGPGDYLISRNETTVEAWNSGTDTVELLNWVLVQNDGFNGHLLRGWTNNSPEVQIATQLPEVPERLVLRRFELAPGDKVPAASAGAFRFRITMPFNSAGTPVNWTISLGRLTDGGYVNLSTNELTVYVLDLQPVQVNATPSTGGSGP